MVYPFNRDKEIAPAPPLPKHKPQDLSRHIDVGRESNQARFDAYDGSHNMESLHSNSRSEIGRDKEQANNSSNLARNHPPLWINPLFVSSLKNEMLPKIPYALGLLGSAFIGMIFQPPVLPLLKHLPYATNAFMQVMKAEEQPIRGDTNEQIEKLKQMDKEQYYLALEQNRQLRRLKAQGNSTYNSTPSQGLSVPENRNSLPKSPQGTPTKQDQAIIAEFMADKERLQMLCDSFILLAHSLPKILHNEAVKARKGPPRFDMGMVGFGGMKKVIPR